MSGQGNQARQQSARIASNAFPIVVKRMVLLAVLLTVMLTVWPAHAAVLIEYFTVTVSATEVTLDWKTSTEFNFEGFQVLLLVEGDAGADYVEVASRPALGVDDGGALYTATIATGLEVGRSYCFRLVELTADGSPGEIFERCGYGLSITPTPRSPAAQPDQAVDEPQPAEDGAVPPDIVEDRLATPTPMTLGPVDPADEPADNEPADNEPADNEPADNEPQDNEPQDNEPLDEDIDPVAPQPGQNQPQSPLQTPGQVAQPQSPLQQPQQSVDASEGAAQNSPGQPLAPADEGADDDLPATPDDQQRPADVDEPVAQAPTIQPQNTAPEPGNAQATPTLLYVVVTATPTPETPLIEPTFTPYPSATPEPGNFLARISSPDTESLLLLTLCFVFVGAGGIGVLGLTSLGLYMRARDARIRRQRRADRLSRGRRLY